jgi:voltage-gated potassium channel
MGAMGAASFAGRIGLGCLAGVVVVGYGVVGYTCWFGFNLVDAIYLTVSTLTTEGFTTPAPLSDGAKLFTVSLALLGVPVFVAVLGVLATAVVDGQLVEKSRSWSVQRRISQLHGHHILCGYGRVGRAAAREFNADGVVFVVIEINPEREDDLRRDGVLYFIGNSSSEALLRAAGICGARGLGCAVDSRRRQRLHHAGGPHPQPGHQYRGPGLGGGGRRSALPGGCGSGRVALCHQRPADGPARAAT